MDSLEAESDLAGRLVERRLKPRDRAGRWIGEQSIETGPTRRFECRPVWRS